MGVATKFSGGALGARKRERWEMGEREGVGQRIKTERKDRVRELSRTCITAFTLPSCGVVRVNCVLKGPMPAEVAAAMTQMKVV